MAMAMTIAKTNCHTSLISKTTVFNTSSSTSLAMALSSGSAICPQLPLHFRHKPTSSLFGKPLFSLSSRQFSSRIITASAKDAFLGSVGFLGIGIMGSPMAQNLIKAGCDVTVWNRTKSKCDPLISLGAKYKPSPEEVAASCDVTIAMLADPDSAVDVAFGKHGAANGMAPGKGYVDVSTVDGATSKLISEHIKATGASFLEAPVSGSKKPAEDGQLIFLTAGDKSLFEKVGPLLDIMGKSKFYLGDVGNGAAMKLVVNMIMGSMMASFSEGLLLSEKVGLDPSVLVEQFCTQIGSPHCIILLGDDALNQIQPNWYLTAPPQQVLNVCGLITELVKLCFHWILKIESIAYVVSQGAISAPMYSMKGPSMVKSTYPTAFPLKHQQKDLRLALGLAESVSQPTPVAAAANELYKVAKSRGLSDLDFSAVIEALKSNSA
ncbi:hypothetical protein Cgig2_022290 [Carnegiea gigantea]|uniref:Uncharacterized protein n=1 Tax=Carnegiea gigantea TaxID=171969 RepID=A0A9Q1KG69_9CARY|nr:hypothetical protein Cgig2_022290 [Carnegiea gigantea]